MIPGRYGWVEPHDIKTLAVCLFRSRVCTLGSPSYRSTGGVGRSETRKLGLLLPIKELDLADETVKAYRRRVVSATQRAELVRRLARIRPEATTLAA